MNGKRQKTRLNKELNLPRVQGEFNAPGSKHPNPSLTNSKKPSPPKLPGGEGGFFSYMGCVYPHLSKYKIRMSKVRFREKCLKECPFDYKLGGLVTKIDN